MDYLNKLPEELWRKIIELIPTEGSSEGFTSTAPLRFLDVQLTLYETKRASQAYRVSLLTICKTLKPLVEEWLYHEVILGHEGMLGEKYLMGASIPQSNGRKCGEWTRSVWIYDTLFPLCFASGCQCGSSLRGAYPNLETIHSVGAQDTLKLYQSIKEISWNAPDRQRITTLTLNYVRLRPYGLQLIATAFDHLTGLSLLSNGGLYYHQLEEHSELNQILDGPIHFPVLTRLFLSWEVMFIFPLGKLDMPNLRWLTMEIGTDKAPEWANVFMRRHGPQLTGLQYSTYAFIRSTSRLRGDLFDLCQNLEVLGIHISKMEALVRSTQAEGDPHIHFRRLILIFKCPIDAQKVRDHAAYFSKAAFPSLEKVTMMAEESNCLMREPIPVDLYNDFGVEPPLHEPSLVHEVAVASLPHVFVELVVQRH